MPTERLLTTQLGTSRTTVRQALSELVGEGRLVRRQGSGTYVAEPKVTWPLLMTSFTEQAAASGYSASTRLVDAARQRADEAIAERLGIRPGAPTYCIERLRLVDESPMAVETSHLSAARFPGLIPRLRKASSLYGVLESAYGVRPVVAEETIETAVASPHEAELLDTDTGSPMLVLGRHSFDADGEPGRVGPQLVSRRPLHLRGQALLTLIRPNRRSGPFPSIRSGSVRRCRPIRGAF